MEMPGQKILLFGALILTLLISTAVEAGTDSEGTRLRTSDQVQGGISGSTPSFTVTAGHTKLGLCDGGRTFCQMVFTPSNFDFLKTEGMNLTESGETVGSHHGEEEYERRFQRRRNGASTPEEVEEEGFLQEGVRGGGGEEPYVVPGELNSTFSVQIGESPWDETTLFTAYSLDCGSVEIVENVLHTEATWHRMWEQSSLPAPPLKGIIGGAPAVYHQYICTNLVTPPLGPNGVVSDLTVEFKIDGGGGGSPSSASDSSSPDQLLFFDLILSGNKTFVKSVALPAAMPTKYVCAPEPENDQLVMPLAGGGTLESPGTFFLNSSTKYPDSSHLQFFGRICSDQEGPAENGTSIGFYISTLDGNGHVKGHIFRSYHYDNLGIKTVFMSLHHVVDELLPSPPVDTFAHSSLSPTFPQQDDAQTSAVIAFNYSITLGIMLTPNGWRNMADNYKTWAVQQSWCRLNLTQRTNVPSWLLEGATAGLIFDINNGEKGNFNPAPFGPNLELMAPNFTNWKNKTGVNTFLGTVYGWENEGVWAGIFYFPPQPSFSAWQAAMKAVHDSGNRVALLVSGYWWVVARQTNDNGPGFNHTNLLQDPGYTDMLVKKNPRGDLYTIDAYDTPFSGQSWRGLSTLLCHGAPNASKTMVDIFTTVSNEIGADVISFDQDIGGGQKPGCYDPTHNHPPGHGSWITNSYRETLEAIRAESNNKQLLLMEEQVSELVIQHTGTYWSRQFGVFNFPQPGVRCQGMFNYIYHEYTTTIAAAVVQGTDCKPFSNDGCSLTAVKALSNAVVRGMILMPFESFLNLDHYREAYLRYTAAMEKYSDFFVKGTMVTPPNITEIEKIPIQWGANKSKGKPGFRTVQIDALSVGAFRWNGKTRVFFVSIIPRGTGCKIQLPSGVEQEVIVKAFEVYSILL